MTTTLAPMRSLIWKEYRLARPLLVLALALFAMIYGGGTVMEINAAWPHWPTTKAWAGMLVSMGTIALLMAFCVTAMFGGHAIACERADRTAHFLAYLPPTKWQILAGKLIVPAIATAVIWAWLLLTVYVLAPRLGGEPVDFNGTMNPTGAASLCALTFGVGWLASALLESSVVPTILALASPVVLGFALLTVTYVLGVPRAEATEWSNPACFGVGAAALVAGTWAYLRRVEP
jgi:ABC-type transport system involved in multi-copper enzyme maturation permease subunit